MDDNIDHIRNFCIIAHIDHGKSTLADRLLEKTGTVAERDMKEQILDQMDLERERGITIKLQPVRMEFDSQKLKSKGKMSHFVLNLIDTPGHVDFTYEVSRSLAAVEGAILLVDAAQGVQAQTLANLYLAVEQGLEILPVINKIDLANADVNRVRKEIVSLLGCSDDEVLSVSAKTGEGVDELLEAVIEKVPPPKITNYKQILSTKSQRDKLFLDRDTGFLQALIFDSVYDEYKGVVAYVRIVTGEVKRGDKIFFIGTGEKAEVLEVGVFTPKKLKTKNLNIGDIGYIVTGLKSVAGCRVGDTITSNHNPKESLPGYQEVKPMVYAGIFSKDGDLYPRLRDAMEKMRLSDASLTFEPDNSPVLGFGFRCGFLGLLHLEIIQERLKREFDLDLVVTTPSVAYRVFMKGKKGYYTIHSPQEFTDPSQIERIEEPWVKMDIVSTRDYMGPIMDLTTRCRGVYTNIEYFDADRLVIHFEIPLASILVDFYDTLKSVSSGYASMNYSIFCYREADVVKMDVFVAEEPVDALSLIVYKDDSEKVGRRIVKTLKETLVRQQFVIKIQAAVGGRIVAAERLSALRKDVTAKLYGGDVTRKRKLLEKQKKGKKRMKRHGKVEIPAKAYSAVLKR